jgi:hypothetical protein
MNSDVIPCLQDQDLPTWHSIIEDYASRLLTFPEDKLKAIAALADLYQTRHRHIYIAGLWKESLMHDLCWCIMPKNGEGQDQRLLPRPRQYRAPSWSWAPVDISEGLALKYMRDWPTSFDFTAKVLDVYLHQEPRTTYGDIRSGYLVMEGLALESIWNGKLDPPFDTLQPYIDIAGLYGHENVEAGIPVTLILIIGRFSRYEAVLNACGLILRKIPGHYERVGFFSVCHSVSEQPYFSGSGENLEILGLNFKRQTVTIM